MRARSGRTLTLNPMVGSECPGRCLAHAKRSFGDMRSQAEPGNESEGRFALNPSGHLLIDFIN